MNTLDDRPRGSGEVDELTTAAERETFRRSVENWLNRCLEFAPRSQLHDITKAMNSWTPR